jgi:hypothetical protein
VEDGLREYQVWLVRQKIIVLTLALLVAKEKWKVPRTGIAVAKKP